MTVSGPTAVAQAASEARRRLAGPLETILRLIVGGVFVYASLDKIANPGDFAQSVFYYRMVPLPLLHPFAMFIPWLELVLGLALILGFWRRGAALLTAGLLLVFIIAIIAALARGLDISCGCFGTGHTVGLDLILRDALMLAACLIVLFYRR